jgi:hypothetical protein
MWTNSVTSPPRFGERMLRIVSVSGLLCGERMPRSPPGSGYHLRASTDSSCRRTTANTGGCCSTRTAQGICAFSVNCLGRSMSPLRPSLPLLDVEGLAGASQSPHRSYSSASRNIPTRTARRVRSSSQSIRSSAKGRASGRGVTRSDRDSGATAAAGIFLAPRWFSSLATSAGTPHAWQPRRNGCSRRRSTRCSR